MKSSKTLFLKGLGVLAIIVLSGSIYAGTKAEAGFFDDVVDFLNPKEHIKKLSKGKLPLPPIPSLPGLPGLGGDFGIPTLPNPLDLVTSPILVPVVKTQNASGITATSARLNGYVNPHGAPDTRAWFQWGTTRSLGNSTSKVAAPLPVTIDVTLEGLTPNTVYYYRVKAENILFDKSGKIKSFRTASGTNAPHLCLDTTAINYGGTLPCVYFPQNNFCRDPFARNYGGTLPCLYHAELCQDPGAINYRGSLPCRYALPPPAVIAPPANVNNNNNNNNNNNVINIRW